MNRRIIFAFLACFALIGCSESDPAYKILYDITMSSVGEMIFQILMWSCLFGVIGLLIGGLVFYIFNHIGAYRWEWEYAKLFRGLTLILMILSFSFFFGLIGFFEGVLRGSHKMFTQGKIAKQVYPAIGNTGADFIALIYLGVSSSDVSFNTISTDKLESFRRNLWELNVSDFINRCDKAAIDSAGNYLKTEAEKSYPALKNNIGKEVLDWFLTAFGQTLIRQTARHELNTMGMYLPMMSFTEGLKHAALRSGDPNTISYRELSDLVVEKIIIAPYEFGIKPFVRSHQWVVVFPLLLTIVLPIICFQTARHFHNPKKQIRSHFYE